MELSEAERLAYTNPSQENLAVYVKLLEEGLEAMVGIEEDLDALRKQAQIVVDSLETAALVNDLSEGIRDLAAALL